ncbi:uncharacterized protein LOC119381144 [Rhipicephalus sanguineus]|uniref:Uncharacterized protein n=1 Tax=Rhipicephalus sanguineus TaxID=34632 RepID=A0A9D4Q4R5_RHISA|nr:uncharacterized protein LOC119381144 [Rhipicephalus sanguineus]KAH7968065.1 hypothetical protein HPB52_005550 [Rhipicephalus sanguineus]
MVAKRSKLVVLAVLVYLATSLCYVSCRSLHSSESFLPKLRIARTLYGTPEEKFFQFMAYKKLKIAVKMQKIECYKRSFCQVSRALGMSSSKTSFVGRFMGGVAELPDSFLGAIGKGWIGQNCTQAYRSCDRAKDYVRRIVDAVLNTKPSVE